jgi:hypothetical protein
MKRFAGLVIGAAFALPCAATEPKVDGTVNPNEPNVDTRQNVFMRPKLAGLNTPAPAPPTLLDVETVKAVLFPVQTAAREAMKRTGLTEWLKSQKFHAEWRLWMNDNGAR